MYRNRYSEALSNYEKGMETSSLEQSKFNEFNAVEHKRLCESGIARTNIKIGNYKKGVCFYNNIISNFINYNLI